MYLYVCMCILYTYMYLYVCRYLHIYEYICRQSHLPTITRILTVGMHTPELFRGTVSNFHDGSALAPPLSDIKALRHLQLVLVVGGGQTQILLLRVPQARVR